jgi:hypothetical protein
VFKKMSDKFTAPVLATFAATSVSIVLACAFAAPTQASETTQPTSSSSISNPGAPQLTVPGLTSGSYSLGACDRSTYDSVPICSGLPPIVWKDAGAYTFQFEATSSLPWPVFSVTDGHLPPGFTLDASGKLTARGDLREVPDGIYTFQLTLSSGLTPKQSEYVSLVVMSH